MKIFDDKGRIGGKLSVVDLFVVALVIACIAAIGVKLGKKETVIGGDKVLVYNVQIENIREMSVEAIKKNLENITEATTKKEIGDIVGIDIKPARVLVKKSNGEFQFVEYDNRYDVVLTMKSKVSETDDAYYTGSGKQITVGETISINNGYSQAFGQVISMGIE
ncbi:MAG: DUF4330 domain-containing protein [Eubacteriales bacterium]|nr:DUF4330 domain-containing protein [Eubacteriales bacterium]